MWLVFFCCSVIFPVLASAASKAETIFQCDHIFDSSKPGGHFQLPVLPPPATGAERPSTPEPLKNMQCIYTFIAGPRQRVKLDFEQFQLAGTADKHFSSCETEYVDIYSEVESAHDDLLSASFGGRYCGSVSPYVRISLHRVIVLVFHSRAASTRRSELKFRGQYSFISDARYNVGRTMAPGKCGFIIEAKNRKRGTILSPTYPGTYPKNFHCTYLLNGKPGQRIRFYLRDFDVYFGGEHCPYDSMTIFDGPGNKSPIIRKVCGLQQRLEVYSLGPDAFLEFNTTKADPRGWSLAIVMFCAFVPSTSAINIKNLYQANILMSFGFDNTQVMFALMAVSILASPMCFLSPIIIERLGRRPLFLSVSALCIAEWFLLGTAQFTTDHINAPVIFSEVLGVVGSVCGSLASMLGLLVFTAIMIGELCPHPSRAVFTQFSTVVSILFATVSVQIYPISVEMIGFGYHLTMLILSATCFIFLYRFLPETKGLPVDEIVKHLSCEHRCPEALLTSEEGMLAPSYGTLTPNSNHNSIT